MCAGDDGRLVTDRRRIAQHYIKGWFTFDVLSSIPYEQILSLGGGTPALFNLLQVSTGTPMSDLSHAIANQSINS